MAINVWTDGSCNNNPKHPAAGYGGWAFIVYVNDELVHEDFFYAEGVTSTIMEMKAVIEALKYTNHNFKNQEIRINSDSAMVVNCFHDKWYENWKAMNWYGVKNTELWKEMLKLIRKSKNKTKFLKVKGHAGIKENERVDYLAGEARKFILEEHGILIKK